LLAPELCGWRRCLEKAEAGIAARDDVYMLEECANDWSCCAVGERLGFPDIEGWRVDDIVRNHDPEMYKLGGAFFEAVDLHKWETAIKLHGKINDPSLDGRAESLRREVRRAKDRMVWISDFADESELEAVPVGLRA